jgi:hypothetical protein
LEDFNFKKSFFDELIKFCNEFETKRFKLFLLNNYNLKSNILSNLSNVKRKNEFFFDTNDTETIIDSNILMDGEYKIEIKLKHKHMFTWSNNLRSIYNSYIGFVHPYLYSQSNSIENYDYSWSLNLTTGDIVFNGLLFSYSDSNTFDHIVILVSLNKNEIEFIIDNRNYGVAFRNLFGPICFAFSNQDRNVNISYDFIKN